MEYNSILNSIPKKWKQTLRKQQIPQNAISNTEPLCLKVRTIEKPIAKLTNKDLYSSLLKSEYSKSPKCVTKWEEEFGNELEWKKIHTAAKVDTKAKIQSFQYAIIHRFFPCGLYLSKWLKNSSPYCSICNQYQIDTISHYFYTCQGTHSLWTDLENWLNRCFSTHNITIKMNCKDIILGFSEPGRHIELLNFITLQAKWFIYCKKINSEFITFREFLQVLKNRLKIEKYIYTLKDKGKLFMKNFEIILPFIEGI